MGCLFALIAVLSPRFAVFLLWAFTNYVDRAFNGWFLPLLGIVFAPWTTLMYVLVYAPAGADSRGGLDPRRDRRRPRSQLVGAGGRKPKHTPLVQLATDRGELRSAVASVAQRVRANAIRPVATIPSR